ncbi:MAG: hypothetical protein HIU89_14245 [Proteobacteria bacterium]|nr:hypothetical protein [Pseudomonadota bacterium]
MCLTSLANRRQGGAVQSGFRVASISPESGLVIVLCHCNVRFGAMQGAITGTPVVSGIAMAALLRDKLGH